ncbi:MAG: DUF2059 domain-containing protein [Pseudolabrys sp.]
MRIVRVIKGAVGPAGVVIGLLAFAAVTNAQRASVAAVQMAKEIVTVTGATAVFNPLILGVIGQAKNLFLQQDPGLGKDLNEIAAKMRTDLAPRFSELTDEVAKLYATHFTEAELKELLAFYRSPVRGEIDHRAAEGRRRESAVCAGLGKQALGTSDHKNA